MDNAQRERHDTCGTVDEVYTTAVLEYLVVEVLELAGVSQKSILSCVVTKIQRKLYEENGTATNRVT